MRELNQKRRLVLSSFTDMLRRAGWTVADSNAFVTIFEKTLKDHGMLLKNDMKSSISEAEAVLNSLWNLLRRDGWTVAGTKLFIHF